ncbi:MAG: hypothetical protein ACXWZU_10400 [Actinomycetota bacterium]
MASTTHRRGTGWTTRVPAVIVMLIGVVLIGTTVVNNLFAVGPAFENLTDDFRPALTAQAIDTARTDIATLGAAGDEFQTAVAPAMAEQLGMTPEEFQAFVGEQFPGVGDGMAALPQIVPTFTGLIDTLDAQRDLFASADAIPTSSLPATTIPWALLIAGILSLALGVFMWFVPRAGGIVAIVMGAMLVIVPVALSLPTKAADADQMNANLEPVYTAEMIGQASVALKTVSAMGTEMSGTMLPALADQLGMTEAELQAFLGENFPATADALQNMPASMERFQGLVGAFEANLDNYDTMKSVSFEPIIWTVIVGGAVMFFMGIWAFVMGRRPEVTVIDEAKLAPETVGAGAR